MRGFHLFRARLRIALHHWHARRLLRRAAFAQAQAIHWLGAASAAQKVAARALAHAVLMEAQIAPGVDARAEDWAAAAQARWEAPEGHRTGRADIVELFNGARAPVAKQGRE